jgi:hypothetical protein
MENTKPHWSRSGIRIGRPVLALAAAVASAPAGAHAAPVAMTASDFSLAVYASSGSPLSNGSFNPHRCLCPDTLTAQLQLTSSGLTDLGSSTVVVSFLLGENCTTSTSSCVSLGQASFSTSSSVSSSPFESTQVFQSAAGGATVNCDSLTAGSTTLSAFLVQDGVALPFAISLELPVIATVVGPPTAVTALPANNGIRVNWAPPADESQVAGYQVLCLPRPAVASTAAYESCGLISSTGGAILTPGDETQVCSAELSATQTSVLLGGLVNGTSYTVAVVSIDPSGGVSALSPQAAAIPQPTIGFFETYKNDGGAANGCSVAQPPRSGRSGLLWMAFASALVVALRIRSRRRHRRRAITAIDLSVVLLLAFGATARAQGSRDGFDADWPSDSSARPTGLPPDWGFELGISLYRPDVDSEFANGKHPFVDTFSSSRHVLSEAELDRYLGHRFGTWGVGLRGGYYRVTGASFLADGTRSGDETALRLIPFSLSLLYRADGLAGLRDVPLIPYAKVGLDGVTWTATSTGESASHSGFTPGWHAAAGMALGLNFLGVGTFRSGGLPDPFALFFEWDYAAINGLGLGGKLHVGDNTWFAGAVFDL